MGLRVGSTKHEARGNPQDRREESRGGRGSPVSGDLRRNATVDESEATSKTGKELVIMSRPYGTEDEKARKTSTWTRLVVLANSKDRAVVSGCVMEPDSIIGT